MFWIFVWHLTLNLNICRFSCFSVSAHLNWVYRWFKIVLEPEDILKGHLSWLVSCLMTPSPVSPILIDTVSHASLVCYCVPSLWTVHSSVHLGHWYTFIYKPILVLLPSYIKDLITQRHDSCFALAVPFLQKDLGKRAFVYSTPSTWNMIFLKRL